MEGMHKMLPSGRCSTDERRQDCRSMSVIVYRVRAQHAVDVWRTGAGVGPGGARNFNGTSAATLAVRSRILAGTRPHIPGLNVTASRCNGQQTIKSWKWTLCTLFELAFTVDLFCLSHRSTATHMSNIESSCWKDTGYSVCTIRPAGAVTPKSTSPTPRHCTEGCPTYRIAPMSCPRDRCQCHMSHYCCEIGRERAARTDAMCTHLVC